MIKRGDSNIITFSYLRLYITQIINIILLLYIINKQYIWIPYLSFLTPLFIILFLHQSRIFNKDIWPSENCI